MSRSVKEIFFWNRKCEKEEKTKKQENKHCAINRTKEQECRDCQLFSIRYRHDMIKGEQWRKLATQSISWKHSYFCIKRRISPLERRKISNVLHEIIPVFHPATIRINALSSSRIRRRILYHLNKHITVSDSFTSRKNKASSRDHALFYVLICKWWTSYTPCHMCSILTFKSARSSLLT